MAQVTLDGIGTVELDCDGHIEKVVWQGVISISLQQLSAALRVAIERKIWIVRKYVVLPDNRPHTYLRGVIDGVDCTGRTIEDLLEAYNARAESVDYVDDPERSALAASAVLAADKGIANEIQRNDYQGFDVVTDTGKRFQFRKS